MKINLSIIVPVYNAKKTLVSCLRSINNQILKSDLSIEVLIIIDDGKKYENIIPKMKKGIQVRILKTQGIKTGPGNARNVGIKKAKGMYIGFLDADDEWSKNYLQNMYNLVKINNLAFAPTRIYRNKKLVNEFKGPDKDYISIGDIGEVPCSFHPFVKREQQGEFWKQRSQDVYNTANLINKNNKKVKMVNEGYYKLNLQDKSVTKEGGFSHKIDIAYRQYQIYSLKIGNYKVARVFALRRINNKKYTNWLEKNKGGFYEFLSERKK
ncbi:glycosyltransferase family 2 protein [Alphaproteobacteria bacterium]|nr:glycosyltransferase family 2 protein [Alphaproteobacteria bacterium]